MQPHQLNLQLLILGLCAFSQFSKVSSSNNKYIRNSNNEMGFRLATVDENLVRCMEGDDIHLESYLTAYREILKIFKEMGTIFNFVTNDLEDKIQILDEYRTRNEIAEHFTSLARMISFELDTGATRKRQPPSGCRTWLRLHRALQFVSLFFSRLSTVDFEDKMTSLAQDCYEQTLARYHGYLVRKGASLAMYALPTVDAMFTKAQDDKQDVRGLLQSVGVNAGRVYDLTQKMFESKGLLSLP